MEHPVSSVDAKSLSPATLTSLRVAEAAPCVGWIV